MNTKKLLALILALTLVLCATPLVFAGEETPVTPEDSDTAVDVGDLEDATGGDTDVLYGDVTGDNEINTFDMLRLLDYLRDDSTVINFDNADVVPGGGINNFDMLRLLDYLREE